MDELTPEEAAALKAALRRWVLYGLLLPGLVAPFLAAAPVLLLSREALSALGDGKADAVWRTLLFGGLPAAPFSVLINSFVVRRRGLPRRDLFLRGLAVALLCALPPTACVFRLVSFTLPALR